jgi:diguanylate cyclase
MPAEKREKRLKFVAMVYRLRVLGLGLGALPVASVLYQQQAATSLWVLLLVNGYIWPHLAYAIASRTLHPARAEQVNLLLDSIMGGIWVALMQFNLLPSALLVSMLAMDRISAGGWRLLAKSLVAQVPACLLVWWLRDMPFQPVSNMLNIVACLPMLMIYPACLSTVDHALGRRVRQQNRLLDQLSRTDTLTGLPNRAHWLETAGKELQRFQRNQRPATLILLDIDGFKQVNDGCGHATGDALLRQLADVLRDNLRDMDTPGRLGGDEFGVVLPETGIERARSVAERICEHAERIGAPNAERPYPWTLSLGVAQISEAVTDVGAWVRRADMALYRAKSQGRNRVCLIRPEPANEESAPASPG